MEISEKISEQQEKTEQDRAYTKSFKSLSDEEFAYLLKGMKGFNILTDNEIDSYLEKSKNEKKEIRGKLAVWTLRKGN